jgi:hypothetical protein
MIEIITLSIITGLSGFAFGYLTKSHNESGWKQMYLDEQKKRVLAEESRDEVHAYAMRLENRLIAQQKELESLQSVVETQTGKSFLWNNVEKQK